jgi:hypothetical protein
MPTPEPASNPAPLQKILWTCLPNGIDKSGNFLKLSVLVSPRLDPGSKPPRLDTFPDFSPWPALFPKQSKELTFSISVVSAGRTINVSADTVIRMPADPAGALPDPDPTLWTKLFPPDTFVQPHGPNHAQRLAGPLQSQGGIRSYPVRNIVGYLKGVHQGIALAPDQALTPQHPVIADMVKALGLVAANHGGVHDVLRTAVTGPVRISARTNPSALNLPSSVSKAGLDFFRLYSFHKRVSSGGTSKRTMAAAAKPDQPPLDFHQMVAAMGDYPQVLRLLGLIIDFEIPRTGLPTDGQIRVAPEWTQGRPGQDLTPWTAYTIDASFSAKQLVAGQPGYAGLDQGLINLAGIDDYHDPDADSLFEIVQIDVDGAGMKHFNFAGMLHSRSMQSQPSGQGGDVNSSNEASLPTLRSAGLSLIGVDRAAAIEGGIQQAAAWNDVPNKSMPVFHADDLLRGYRVDILDESAPVKVWRSLCERVGTYQLKDGSSLSLPPDEGYVKGASGTSDDANNLYLHESLFRWTGWSLCARRPGKTIVDQSAGSVSNQAPEGIGLSVTFQPRPGSLPRLRYGHSYRVRMRAVDLAGNSLKLDPTPPPPPDPTHPLMQHPFSESVVFTRFEQIDPPVVVLRDVLTEGESVERLVIRSNYNQTARDYSQNPQVLAARQEKPYNPTNERHLAPPKTSQLMAELHGMFDKAVGSDKGGADRDAGYRVACREAGTLADTKIIDVVTGETHDVPTVKQIPNAAGSGGEYVIHSEEQLLVPYLPDCISRGAALRGVPGVSAGTLAGDVSAEMLGSALFIKVPFAGSWPDNKPFRIRVQERLPGTMPADDGKQSFEEKFTDTGQPQWDAASRLLTVFLAKGQVARISYSSYPDVSNVMVNGVPQLGWLKWSIEALSPNPLSRGDKFDDIRHPRIPPGVKDKMVQGWVDAATRGSSSSSPGRELVLVHAVQQPLSPPVFDSLSPDLAWDRDSTSTDSALGATYVPLSGQIRLSGCSTGRLDVLASWTEWVDNPAEAKPKQINGRAHVAELQIPDNCTDQFVCSSQAVRHKFGDTKYRSVDYHLLATTRFREYFPPSIAHDPRNITREGPVLKVKIPNRARPAAPKVLYVVPTFGWEGVHDPTTPPGPRTPGSSIVSRRLGGGIRVYLDRPWFSSGDGELLGVVFWPYDPPRNEDQRRNFDRYKNLVTQWGKDPMFVSDDPPSPAPAPVDRFKGIALAEAGKPQMAYFEPLEIPWGWAANNGTPTILVVGYPVHYDEQRRLWYADIQFDAGSSYCPFIRLALARYQPNSIEHAEISPIVMADFAQVLPDRTANIHISADMKTLTVEVLGIEPAETFVSKIEGAAPPPLNGRNYIVVAAERRDPNNTDPDLGWLPATNTKVEGSKPMPSIGPIHLSIGAKPEAKEQTLTGATSAPQQVRPEHQLWRGTVTMPEPIVAGKYRLVIKEFESHFQDGAGHQDRVVGNRLTYADAINL